MPMMWLGLSLRCGSDQAWSGNFHMLWLHLERWLRGGGFQEKSRLTDIENKLVFASGEREGGTAIQRWSIEWAIRYRMGCRDVLYHPKNRVNVLQWLQRECNLWELWITMLCICNSVWHHAVNLHQ